MADSFDALLQAIGFPAAQGANRLSLIDRKLQQGQADIARQGDLDRRNLIANQEGNGVLFSGETGTKLSDQAAAEASQQANLSLATADDIYNVQAATQQAQAQQQAQQMALDQQKRQFDLQQQLLTLKAPSVSAMSAIDSYLGQPASTAARYGGGGN